MKKVKTFENFFLGRDQNPDMRGCEDKEGNLILSGDKFSNHGKGSLSGYVALQTDRRKNRVQGQLGEEIKWFNGSEVWLTQRLNSETGKYDPIIK